MYLHFLYFYHSLLDSGTQNFRIVQEEGIHLRPLIYLSNEEFNLLKVLRFNFLKRAGLLFEKQPQPRFTTQRQSLEYSLRQELSISNGNTYPDYEATNILATRNSLLWSWIRVKEYYRDFLGIDDDGVMKKVEQLIYS